MEINRLLEIAHDREKCDFCEACADGDCFACNKVDGITAKDLQEYHSAVYDALRRIAEDDKAREEGRLVELPIPVGGCLVAYGIYEEEGVPAHIVTIECDRLEGLEIWPTGEVVINIDGWQIGRSDIGKTVFLTRQEAEAALSGGGEGG